MFFISELWGVTEIWCHTITLLAARRKRAHPTLTRTSEAFIVKKDKKTLANVDNVDIFHTVCKLCSEYFCRWYKLWDT